MIEVCIEAGLPEPIIEEKQGGFSITFRKDIWTEEFIKNQNLPDRQTLALLFIKEKGSINNAQFQEIAQTSKRTATRDLQELIEKGLIQKSGTTGKGTTYIFQKRTDV